MVILRAVIVLFLTGLVGGVIAFLGNQLGRYIGRKKMSVFKLRPRYTSMLITILTGMLIASATLGLAMIFSEDVRITLLTPEEYTARVNDLTDKISKLRSLQQTDLLYKKQDIILSAVIKAKPDINLMREALKEVVSAANDAAVAKNEMMSKERGESYTPPPAGKMVGYIPSNLTEVAEKLSWMDGDYVIFVRANHHAAIGDRFRVEIGSPLPNTLVYKKNEVIYNGTIDGQKDYFEIYDELFKIIKNQVSQRALYKGLFPNPDDRSVGEFDENELKKTAREIKKKNDKVNIEFYTLEDTYILGPLKLGVKIDH